MLNDPRGGRLAAESPEQWLFGRQQTHALDTVMFPDCTPALARASSDELALVFAKLIRERRSVLELLDADYTFVNENLAALYGIKDVKDRAMREVKLTDRRRSGLLGMAIAHQKTSMPSRTSPTNRGKWVLDALLGTPPPPPPDVNNSVDGNAREPEGRPLTLREKLARHGKPGTSCAACHLRMDPLGFALENFDPVGRFREKDGNRPVENTGKLPDGTELQGVEGLKRVLMQRKNLFVRNLVEHPLTYALGRDLQAYDLPTVRRITTAVTANQYRADVLVEEVVRSYHLRRRPDLEGPPRPRAPPPAVHLAGLRRRAVRGRGMHGLRATSKDGERWDNVVTGEVGEHLNEIVWTGREFAALGIEVTYKSPDGVRWSKSASDVRPARGCYGAGVFLCTNLRGTQCYRSEDAVRWKPVPRVADCFFSGGFAYFD